MLAPVIEMKETHASERLHPDRTSIAVVYSVGLGLMAVLVGFVFHRQSTLKFIAETLVSKNEALAESALYDIFRAEVEYHRRSLNRSGTGMYWTADLAGLYTSGVLGSLSLARADVKPREPLPYEVEPYCGYYFVAMNKGPDGEDYQQVVDAASGKVHHASQFGFCAYPALYGVTGRHTFLLTDEEILMYVDYGGLPVMKCPPPRVAHE